MRSSTLPCDFVTRPWTYSSTATIPRNNVCATLNSRFAEQMTGRRRPNFADSGVSALWEEAPIRTVGGRRYQLYRQADLGYGPLPTGLCGMMLRISLRQPVY